MPTPVLRSHISEYSTSAALSQCQHSTHQDGQVFTPNIPDTQFDPARFSNNGQVNQLLFQLSNESTYFFTIPSESAERNCSGTVVAGTVVAGTVVAIQYCYRFNRNRMNIEQDVFSFHSVTRDGFVFTVTSSFTVRTTPLDGECNTMLGANYFCCGTTTLSAASQLSISPDAYSFGVTILSDDVMPYAFGNDDKEFVVERFQASLGTTIPPGTSYDLMQSGVTGGLMLMRLFIGKS